MGHLRECVKNNKLQLGTWLQLPDVFIAEIAAKAGFDWLAIDMEHGLIDLDDVFRLIQVVGLSGSVPLVRLNANDPSTIRRVMDAGAGGVIVPMVNSKNDAIQAIEALKYPPQGKRSFGLGRAHDFGSNFEGYIRNANQSSVLVVQIEHIEAVKNIDSILKLREIDAVIIGPYDLSGSIGVPGKFNDNKFSSIIKEILTKVKKSDKALGIHIVHPSEKELKNRIAEGFSFIGYGTDAIFFKSSMPIIDDIKKRFQERLT